MFNGKIKFHEDTLLEPLRWKKPRMVFVNSMCDLFHESVPFEFIDRVFAVMALSPLHTFQVLTKRPERMAEYFVTPGPITGVRAGGHTGFDCEENMPETFNKFWEWFTVNNLRRIGTPTFPLPNVWLGTSCENQATADERIPHLLKCPAAVRFLSCEPLLGPIDLDDWITADND